MHPPSADRDPASPPLPDTADVASLAGVPGIQLQPEEPTVATWRADSVPGLLKRIRAFAGRISGRPIIVAVDGRGGSGKSALTDRLLELEPHAGVLHVDDLDWNEPLFDWEELLVRALGELCATGALDLVPPAWPRHGRDGSILIPAGAPIVFVEGTGAGMRAVTGLIDVHLWVQTDYSIAERRGIGRDIEEGANGDAKDTVEFWHSWQAAERRFFAEDRPWERAHLIVCGQALPGIAPEDLAWAPGPLTAPED